MRSPVQVIAYAGYRGAQEPRELVVEGERFAVLGIDDRWQDPSARYFKVGVADGRVYLLRCDAEELRWTVVKVWTLDA